MRKMLATEAESRQMSPNDKVVDLSGHPQSMARQARVAQEQEEVRARQSMQQAALPESLATQGEDLPE